MEEMKLKQLQYESETWGRLLIFMNDEIIRFKTRLSEVIRAGFDDSLLNELEHFQTHFLEADEWIILLRNELAELNMLLIREQTGDIHRNHKAESKTGVLRKQVTGVEVKFRKLKESFHEFLADKILYQ
jgi:hypothetical protein